MHSKHVLCSTGAVRCNVKSVQQRALWVWLRQARKWENTVPWVEVAIVNSALSLKIERIKMESVELNWKNHSKIKWKVYSYKTGFHNSLNWCSFHKTKHISPSLNTKVGKLEILQALKHYQYYFTQFHFISKKELLYSFCLGDFLSLLLANNLVLVLEMYYVHKMHHTYLIHTIHICMHAQGNMPLKYFTKTSDTSYKGKAQRHKDRL